MNQTLLLKDEIETFLYREADYCDNWQLNDWLRLWADGEVLYEVGPLDKSQGDQLSPRDVLFLVSDNRFRLEQRVLRMGKNTAHAEYPVRSRLRHVYGNLRDIESRGDEVLFKINLLVSRTRRDTEGVTILPGYATFRLLRCGGELKIREKRIFLDLHVLANPGTMSIII